MTSLFVIWSLTSFVFEVPSGAWADTVGRRGLLVLSGLIYAVGFASWVVWPAYLGFALGFVLWGLSSAIMSGTFEALLYDELAARSATDEYPRIIGWANATAMSANLVATLSCGALFAWGGYRLVGWTSVAVALAHAGLAWSLPAAPKIVETDPAEDEPSFEGGLLQRYVSMLEAGVRESVQHSAARHLVLICALLLGLLAYDEYFPLVAREAGASTAQVPVAVAVVVAGQLVGTALAGRTARMGPRTMAVAVATAAGLISLGAVSGSLAGFGAIAVGYGVLHNTIIVSEARLQSVIAGPARATVTSVMGLSGEVVALAVFAMFALGSGWLSVASLVAVLGLPTLAAAAAIRRWLPPAPANCGKAADSAGPISTGCPRTGIE